ncbi:hypothetical protein ACFOMD_11220 [Sphingoaurantiacus capsulatus]|uniref:Lipoprotein n=1 Tax=Sphingoaurantiacus capsulatus TaxID=1771310 RepID=A0ABV7XD26_9SPHN
MRGLLKGLLTCLSLALGGLLLLGLLLNFACVSRDEVSHLTSPDGAVEATLIETNGGATTSFGYEVRLRRADSWFGSSTQVAYFYGAVRSECAYGVNMRWTGPTTLQLEYLRAYSADVDDKSRVGGKRITIAARSGVADPSAACGGMEYNRLGRPYG